MQDYSVTTFWDTSAKQSDNTSRIMLTVYLNRKQFRITLKLRSTKDNYLKAISGKGGNDEIRDLRKGILNYIDKAESIFKRFPNINKETFLKFFKSENDFHTNSKTSVYPFFEAKRELLLKEMRFGFANCIKNAWYAVKKFNPELCFEDITEDFLKEYRSYLINKGNSLTTASMYIRGLRTLYNEVVEANIISGANNPFKKVQIGYSSKSKNVLYPEQLKKLWEYKPVGLMQSRAKAFFFFSYLCNGMNFADIGRLKYQNIRGDIMTFVRHKTKDTTKHGKLIKVYLHDEVKAIIKEFGNPSKKPDDFLFPMFANCKSELHLHNTILRYKGNANKMLFKISKTLELDIRVNMALARHSFATKQKLAGTPISFISDAMGHSSMLVTEHYLKSLPDDNLKVMSDNLLSF